MKTRRKTAPCYRRAIATPSWAVIGPEHVTPEHYFKLCGDYDAEIDGIRASNPELFDRLDALIFFMRGSLPLMIPWALNVSSNVAGSLNAIGTERRSEFYQTPSPSAAMPKTHARIRNASAHFKAAANELDWARIEMADELIWFGEYARIFRSWGKTERVSVPVELY